MASIEAAIAGECAHDQDAFWAYSEALFDSIYPDRNLRNSQKLDPPALQDLAADIGLDTATFDRCVGNFESLASQCEREFRACQSETSDANACNAAYVDCLSQDPKFAAVMADREALSALIDDLPSEEQKRAERIGTPTFFINGRLLIGAQPFSAFERIIEEELDRASSSP
jgi:predicted DsbA family dithiol-disulfide isomerase